MEILKAIINIYLNIIKEIFGLSVNKAKAELKKAKEKKEAQSFETSEENESNRENKLKKCKFPPKTSTTNLILNIFGTIPKKILSSILSGNQILTLKETKYFMIILLMQPLLPKDLTEKNISLL